MFCCTSCGSHQFEFMVQPGQELKTWVTPQEELMLQVGSHQPFVADRSFMNRYASCKSCNSTQCWDYWFEATATTANVG
jgi:hypothetical protein